MSADTEDPCEALVELWNAETSQPLAKVRGLTPRRRQHIRTRLKERPLDEWRAVIQRIAASDFCCGRVPASADRSQPWIATFDWLVRSPDTALKVLEGQYDNRRGRSSGAAGDDYQETQRFLDGLRGAGA